MSGRFVSVVLAVLLCGLPAARAEDKPAPKIDYRTRVYPPVDCAKPAKECEEAPSDAEVLRALEPCACVPYVCEECRDDVQVVTEKLTDHVDEARFFPLVGIAQLHHCHWKCTVY